ncbi:Protein phosphatase inhibitor 2 [Smittium culicis]|uniref:Protein phosphatase inhibitor 2 n=1 Tax=Smittium culicis TaxID=133412 RepID=A0A1R1X632_9FUNG|nr:Protein phosphatase inhibitor 2 [Smittium culicis]
MDHTLQSADSIKGILKKSNLKNSKPIQLKWDEENLRITELQKDSTMKIDEPKTPYIHYNIEDDASLQDLDDLQLSPRSSSRTSSVTSSPKKAKFAVKEEWGSDEEENEDDKEDKASNFAKLRSLHYQNEGVYVSKKREQFWDIQNGKFVVEKEFMDTERKNSKFAKTSGSSRVLFNEDGTESSDLDSYSEDNGEDNNKSINGSDYERNSTNDSIVDSTSVGENSESDSKTNSATNSSYLSSQLSNNLKLSSSLNQKINQGADLPRNINIATKPKTKSFISTYGSSPPDV